MEEEPQPRWYGPAGSSSTDSHEWIKQEVLQQSPLLKTKYSAANLNNCSNIDGHIDGHTTVPRSKNKQKYRRNVHKSDILSLSDDAVKALLRSSKCHEVTSHADLILSTIRSDDNSVVNLSKHPLTEAQRSILSKGLTFCPTPGEPDMGELRGDFDKFHRRLKLFTHFNRDSVPEDRPKRVNSCTNIPATGDTTHTGADAAMYVDVGGRRIWVITGKQRSLGPFTHPTFTNPSTYEPPNTLRALETLIDTNEFDLSKVKFNKARIENITKE